jgi:hypothetical protein
MSAASMAGVLAWMTAAAGTIASFAASLEHNWVTAGAAVVSAIFAGTIYTVNRKQLKRSKEVERAYISGGGPFGRTHDEFAFTVNNYGKTPGVLLEYAVAFCSITAIPPVPDYRRIGFHDRIAPGGIKETRVVAYFHIPTEIPRPLLVYGRYWYEDIWSDRHTSGFVLVIEANTTHGHVPPGIPAAYTQWD